MSLPTHLVGKLRDEYSSFSDPADAIRCATTLAGLYSGVIGPRIDGPWNVVAKIQWLLKAIELGSHAAVTLIILDKDALDVVEEYGPVLQKLRHQSFISPQLDIDALHRRLKGFAEMPDKDSANVLVWLGGNLDFDKFTKRLNEQSGHGRADSDVVDYDVNTRHLDRFTPNRHADLELVDSDAFDLHFTGGSQISLSVYNNALEDFIMLAEKQGIQPKDDDAQSYMAAAIFHGSLDIVRYLVHQYRVEPNDSWNDMTHLNHSILFRRPLIVEFFLEHGAVLEEACGEKLSGLHLVSRHDDPEFLTMLCEHLRERGKLSTVLESRTTDGPLSGWTVAYTAMCCHAWKNLELLLQYGADPNCTTGNDEPTMIELAVRPTSPAAPISILKMLLEKGVRLNDESVYSGSLLMWAIGSSNALAVFNLLLYGAAVSDAALEDADETEAETASSKAIVVLDEDGKECKDAWAQMCDAASLIVKLVRIGRERHQCWEQELKEAIQTPSQGWRGKMWIKDAETPSYITEIRVPDSG
jgi:ankyrin repeat protein